MYRKRLDEIENELELNQLHRSLMDLFIVTIGLSTVKAFSDGSFVSIFCDVVCVIIAARAVSMAADDDKELLRERASILEREPLMDEWRQH